MSSKKQVLNALKSIIQASPLEMFALEANIKAF